MRERALAPLIGCAAFNEGELPAALGLIRARRFEQDLVRCVMFEALGALPLGCFSQEALPALAEVFQHALDAAHLSTATSIAIERLVVRVFSLDPIGAPPG